jgi:hypothetical protein
MRRREGEWAPAEWAAVEAEPAEATPSEWGAPAGEEEPPPEVAFTVTGSAVFPTSGDDALFFPRHGAVGGELARCWVAATIGGDLTVIDYAHGGSSADPRVFVPALAAATRIPIDLGLADVTAEEVADAIVAALDGAGIEATAEATDDPLRWRVTIVDATDRIIPPDVDTTDLELRGMWGPGQRNDWGTGAAGQALNGDGGTGGTGAVHVDPLGAAGRILGAYIWTRVDGGAWTGRLIASTGPAYSLAPGALTTLLEGVVTCLGFGVVTGEAQPVGAATHLWAEYRSDTGGGAGIRFRLHGQVPVGRGQAGEDERLLWDVTSPMDSGSAVGASYTPTVDTSFAIYVMIGLIMERPDASGNYAANGRWSYRIGDQNPDRTHGTQYIADETELLGEGAHHRLRLPSLPQMRLEEVHRNTGSLGAGHDSRAAVYRWPDDDVPSTTPATRVADLGNMNLQPNAVTTLEVADGGVEVGTEVFPGGRSFSVGFNFMGSGGDPTDFELPVFVENAGDRYFGNAWPGDERVLFHDYIPGASNIALDSTAIEYRTRAGMGNLGMPTTTGAPWPATFQTDASDDSPPAIPITWMIYIRDGMQAA